MFGALYDGERVYWIRHRPHHSPDSRTILAAPYGAKSGVLRQLADCGLGMREYVYGASVGWAVGQERSTTHKYGDRVVVCRFTGGVVESKKRWTAEEESYTGNCDPDDGMGDECASAELAIEHHGAQRIRVHIDGSGSDADCGDSIRTQRPQLHLVKTRRRDQQFPIPSPFREYSIPHPKQVLFADRNDL